MTSENFCYWLQGFAELSSSQPTAAQWDIIKEHLGLVFNKVTTASLPDATNETPSEEEHNKYNDLLEAITVDRLGFSKTSLPNPPRYPYTQTYCTTTPIC
jgi:hypothetical protein